MVMRRTVSLIDCLRGLRGETGDKGAGKQFAASAPANGIPFRCFTRRAALQLYVHRLHTVLHTVNKAICKRVYEAPEFMIFVFLHVKTSKAKNCEHISPTISLFLAGILQVPRIPLPPPEPIRRLTASFFNTINCSDESEKT